MIWEKPIHTVPPETRLIPGAGFPAGTVSTRPSKSVDRSRKFIEFGDEQDIANVLHSFAPFIDSAYYVTALNLSDRSTRGQFVSLFEAPLDAVLKVADLLFIRYVDEARDEDLRFIRHLIRVRKDQGKITAVDSTEALKPQREEE